MVDSATDLYSLGFVTCFSSPFYNVVISFVEFDIMVGNHYKFQVAGDKHPEPASFYELCDLFLLDLAHLRSSSIRHRIHAAELSFAASFIFERAFKVTMLNGTP